MAILTRLALVLVLAAATGCADCPRVRQVVTINSPDPEMALLIEACRNRTPPSPEVAMCPTVAAGETSAVDCPCLPLCQRVMTVIDQFPGNESLDECRGPGIMMGFQITVGYRTCR